MPTLLLAAVLAAWPMLETPTVSGPIVRACPDYGHCRLVIENITIEPSGPGQTAIDLSWPEAFSVAEPTVIIRNVTIRPGFAHGIVLRNAWNAVIRDVAIWDTPDNLGTKLVSAVTLDGWTMAATIDGLRTYGGTTAIYVTGNSESPTITNTAIVGAYHGIIVSTPVLRPGLNISGTHVDAVRVGLWLHNRVQGVARDLLLYRSAGRDAGVPYNGVMVTGGAQDLTLSDITILGQGGPVGPSLALQLPAAKTNVTVRNVTARHLP